MAPWAWLWFIAPVLATPRSGRSGPGSARSTGRRVLATPHDRREAQQDAADRAAVAALH